MVPNGSQIGVVLIGGDGDAVVGLELTDCPPCPIDYIQNDMSSLGGDYRMMTSLVEATNMLRNDDSGNDKMLVLVTHGAPLDASESPCNLEDFWNLLQYRIITIMDGDVGPTDAIDCKKDEFLYPNASLYFNHTNEYHLNLVSIQAATDLPIVPCTYDGWYENNYGERPGGYPAFDTLSWMPFNGTLYFDTGVNDWVVDANIGSLLQMNGPDVAHPPWVGAWNEYAADDSTYTTAIGHCPAVQVSCGDPPV